MQMDQLMHLTVGLQIDKPKSRCTMSKEGMSVQLVDMNE